MDPILIIQELQVFINQMRIKERISTENYLQYLSVNFSLAILNLPLGINSEIIAENYLIVHRYTFLKKII